MSLDPAAAQAFERLEKRLEQIETLFRTQAVAGDACTKSPHDTLSRAQVRELLACKSEASLCRRAKTLGIRPFAKGLYRRGDITNAIARASLRAQKQGRAA